MNYEENFQGFASGFYGDILLPGWQAKRAASIDVRNAWQVEECLRIGLNWVDRLGERCTTVHHEALCASPINVMHRLMDHLDLAYAEGQLERLVTGVAPIVEKRWPSGGDDGDAAAVLFLDPGSVDDLASLNRLAVELGYDRDVCGRRIQFELCSCEMK